MHHDTQVHPVNQRSGQLAALAPLLCRAAHAVTRVGWRTRAEVGRQHQLDPALVPRDTIAAGETDLTVLQWSTKCLQRTRIDLGELIEEQHPTMGTTHRAWTRHSCASA